MKFRRILQRLSTSKHLKLIRFIVKLFLCSFVFTFSMRYFFSNHWGKDLDILFQERVEPKDCACPDFKIDNDIIKQWLHTEKINPGLLDFEKLRKIPKSRLPNSISHIKLKIIQHQLYVSGLKFESIGSHNVAIGVSPVYLHFSSLFMNVLVNTKPGDIPDMEMIINPSPCENELLNPGVMTWSRRKGLALLPSDYEALCVNEPYLKYIAKSGAWYAVANTRNIPWINKINKVVWRGSCTGDKGNYNNHVRFKTAEVGNMNIDILDTKLIRTGPCKSMGSYQAHANALFEKQEVIGRQDLVFDQMLRYKFNIDANGDCDASQRFAKLLLGKTLVLKSDGHSSTFLTRLAKPWKHYVPFNKDASNLANISRNLLSNPDFAENIVKSAESFASELLSPHGLFCYMYHLLKIYGDMFTYKPILHSDDTLINYNISKGYISSRYFNNLRGWPNHSRELGHTRCRIVEFKKRCRAQFSI